MLGGKNLIFDCMIALEKNTINRNGFQCYSCRSIICNHFPSPNPQKYVITILISNRNTSVGIIDSPGGAFTLTNFPS